MFVTSFTWTSSNPRVATIDSDGVASGVSLGAVQITARAEGRTAQARLEVVVAPHP